MPEYLKYNFNGYLYKDRKKYAYFYLVPIVTILLLLFYSYKKEAYNVYETNAKTICNEVCQITFYFPYKEGFSYDFIKINGKKYEVEETFFGDVMLDSSNEGIQSITLKVKEYEGKNQEFVRLQIYKNKEKFIKKIIKIMKER